MATTANTEVDVVNDDGEVGVTSTVDKDNSEVGKDKVPMLTKQQKLAKLHKKYNVAIVHLIENGKVSVCQVPALWLFLDTETSALWSWYAMNNSGKYLAIFKAPDLNDRNADYQAFQCHRWPKPDDCGLGKSS
jgi:hypothetical protein